VYLQYFDVGLRQPKLTDEIMIKAAQARRYFSQMLEKDRNARYSEEEQTQDKKE
jgi:hypothetical protein